jgi:hypothetical protein
MCFRVSQAFFPRTNEWDKLKKALKGEFDDAVWEHLAGTVSAPFEPGENKQIAVKVIDDRGNELLVVKKLEVIDAVKNHPPEHSVKRLEQIEPESMSPSHHIDAIFAGLGFKKEKAWRVKVGTVEIVAGLSPRGISMTFSEATGRNAARYEAHAPAKATQESVGKLIRMNLQMNHASSLKAWDELQAGNARVEPQP